MRYSELWGAMKHQNLLSDAWLDYLDALDRQIDGAFIGDVGEVEAPAIFSDYWSAVARGNSPDYDARGGRASRHRPASSDRLSRAPLSVPIK
jgi:hypothetical protein